MMYELHTRGVKAPVCDVQRSAGFCFCPWRIVCDGFLNIRVVRPAEALLQFLYNKTNQMHQFPKFTPAWNSTCFVQFLCPSSGVYSLYARHWYMSYNFEDSCLQTVRHIPVPSVQWINSWWRTEELPETCRVSYLSKFGKLVHLVGFIIKKFATMQGHMNVKLLLTICTAQLGLNLNLVIELDVLAERGWKLWLYLLLLLLLLLNITIISILSILTFVTLTIIIL